MDQATFEQMLKRGPYGYQPVLSAPIVFLVIFCFLTLAHGFQAYRSRHQLWVLILPFACFAETVGHALRVYGHFYPMNKDPYIAMQVILVLTPAFLAATHFTILGKISTMFPPSFSMVKPSWILPGFAALDLTSLSIQGGGSGVAATAQIAGKSTRPGGNIVLVGLVLQLIGYIAFNLLLLSFVKKCGRMASETSELDDDKSVLLWDTRMKRFVAAVFVSSLLIFLRSVYRTVEMAVGWSGIIAHSEWTFYSFDAALVSAATLILNLYHPGDHLDAGRVPNWGRDAGFDRDSDAESQEKGKTGSRLGEDLE
ncbi:RTA1-domain-containing protein [Violaceomyces palustris]|uniref:RTA1-domain-containing protein n=1 Tax=Violaceomyces palustris TaxID=1673888 RepID=A0ACD0NYJ6_9BASI|nr:RTA1-domain-containing protein [Violaceomyces palustris]